MVFTGFFSSPRPIAKNLFILCFLFLILQHLLSCHHSSITQWLKAWAEAYPLWSYFWDSIWHLGVSTVKCHCFPMVIRQTRVPMTPETLSTLRQSSYLLLTTKSPYHPLGCCCCSMRSVVAPPTMASREPVFIQFKTSWN